MLTIRKSRGGSKYGDLFKQTDWLAVVKYYGYVVSVMQYERIHGL